MLNWKAKPKEEASKVMKTHFERAGVTSDPIDQHPAM